MNLDKLTSETSEASGAMTSEREQKKELESKPRKWLGLALRYLVPLALTVLLVWYMFHSVPFSEVMSIIRKGANYWWILLAMIISVFSHIFRAARWRLQLNALGVPVPFMALCCSIFGCYALNLVFPRLGEVWRCTYVAKKGNSQFTTVLGSMVSDRLTDTLSVLALTLFTFVVANSAIISFLNKYPVGRDLLSLFYNPWIWIAAVALIAGVILVFRLGKNNPFIQKILKWLGELWLGFATLWQMKGKGRFLLLTIAIWGCYFVQLYVAFFAFDFTRNLCSDPDLAFGLIPCLVAFVLSSIGMAIPSNGGLGPWNIAVMFGLAIYGISDTDGTAFSWLQWTGQTVMLIILGIYTMIYIALSKNKTEVPASAKTPAK